MMSARPSGSRCGEAAPREFSLTPQQGDVRAAYVRFARFSNSNSARPGKVNTILAGRWTASLTRAAR